MCAGITTLLQTTAITVKSTVKTIKFNVLFERKQNFMIYDSNSTVLPRNCLKFWNDFDSSWIAYMSDCIMIIVICLHSIIMTYTIKYLYFYFVLICVTTQNTKFIIEIIRWFFKARQCLDSFQFQFFLNLKFIFFFFYFFTRFQQTNNCSTKIMCFN